MNDNSISLGEVQSIYGICGPSPPDWQDTKWTSDGPRCPRCMAIIEETGEDTFCGRHVVVATFREEPS